MLTGITSASGGFFVPDTRKAVLASGMYNFHRDYSLADNGMLAEPVTPGSIILAERMGVVICVISA